MANQHFQKHISGTTCECLAAYYFTARGYTVSLPIDKFGEYDFIADNGENQQRVQVKKIYYDEAKQRYVSSLVTAHVRRGRKINKKYEDGAFDLFAFVCPEYNAIYIIPLSELIGRRSLTFYLDRPQVAKKDKYPNFERYRRELIKLNDVILRLDDWIELTNDAIK